MSKIILTNLFKVSRCSSKSLESYSSGVIPLVSSTTLNNGVEKMVEPQSDKELIISVPCIAVSGFGFATVQTKPFIGTGNNGAYVKALTPIKKMSMMELIYFAAQINMQSWRFSYGRLAIKQRVELLELVEFNLSKNDIIKINDELDNTLKSSYKKVVGI